jgi:hypothetical protein
MRVGCPLRDGRSGVAGVGTRATGMGRHRYRRCIANVDAGGIHQRGSNSLSGSSRRDRWRNATAGAAVTLGCSPNRQAGFHGRSTYCSAHVLWQTKPRTTSRVTCQVNISPVQLALATLPLVVECCDGSAGTLSGKGVAADRTALRSQRVAIVYKM